MHAVPRRASVLPLLLVAGLALAGCGGGSDDDESGGNSGKDLPKVKQDGILNAPDVATANARCLEYQDAKPGRVTQFRFRVKGSPSVLCIIQ